MLDSKRGPAQEVAQHLALPFVWLRIPPNALTVFGTLLALVPASLAYYQEYFWAGMALGIVSLFDTIDGAVARSTGKVTPFGGYLDSVLDRLSDALVLFGIGMGVNDPAWWLVVAAAVLGQFLTSYSKARAFEDGRPPPQTWKQHFERAERILFLVFALLLQGLADLAGVEANLLFWALLIYAILTLGTALRRVLKVREFLAQTSK